MDPEVLEKLRSLDAGQLREALAELCLPFGQVANIEIIPTDDAYICLIDLATPGQNAALCRQLGGFSYASSVGFRIPLKSGS